MTELKRSVDRDSLRLIASKRQKVDMSVSNKERKEKFGDRVTALQQLVSPYGKTDTASVLLEAMDYIKFLHDQLKVLSAPYLQDMTIDSMEGYGQCSLRSKGLCLMPTSYTDGLPDTNGADIWAPTKSSSVDSVILGKEERV